MLGGGNFFFGFVKLLVEVGELVLGFGDGLFFFLHVGFEGLLGGFLCFGVLEHGFGHVGFDFI